MGSLFYYDKSFSHFTVSHSLQCPSLATLASSTPTSRVLVPAPCMVELPIWVATRGMEVPCMAHPWDPLVVIVGMVGTACPPTVVGSEASPAMVVTVAAAVV